MNYYTRDNRKERLMPGFQKNKTSLFLILLSSLIITLLIPSLCASASGEIISNPDRVMHIEEEAFMGDASLNEIEIPQGTESIGSRAFAYSGLKKIIIPESVKYIADDSFLGTDNPIIFASESSYAHEYALAQQIYYRNTDYPIYISVIGDSISSYKGIVPEDCRFYYYGENAGVSSPDEMWWSIVASNIGAVLLTIHAFSGCTVTKGVRNPAAYIEASRRDQYDSLGKNGIDPDIIFVAVGTNDFSYGAPLGEIVELGSLDADNTSEFCSAYENMLSGMKELYPNATIICIGTFFVQRGNLNEVGEYENKRGLTAISYSEKIQSIAGLFGLEYVDTSIFGFNKDNYFPKFCQDYQTTPTHPNALGHSIIGNSITDYIVPILHELFE